MARAKKTAEKTDVEEIKEVEAEKPLNPLYLKADILQSNHFGSLEKDFLSAFLDDGEYTIAEARTILTKKLKGAVN